jgi:ElaB/YqjD/DUF883 family membrane-anchored ribosome-binding protein
MAGSPVNRLEPHWTSRSLEQGATEKNSLTEKVEQRFGNLANMMGRSPKATLAAAAGLGLLLGWIVKRK